MSFWASFKAWFGGKQQQNTSHAEVEESIRLAREALSELKVTATLIRREELRVLDENGVLTVEGWSSDLKGREFRYVGDPPALIRLSQKDPPGFRLERDVMVAGISYEPARSHATAFIAGKERRLSLERDPTNSHDSHAIKVIGQWKDQAGNERRGQVGWVPKEMAEVIAQFDARSELSATIWTMLKPVDGKNPGLRMDIWYTPAPPIEKPKRKRAKKVKESEDLREIMTKLSLICVVSLLIFSSSATAQSKAPPPGIPVNKEDALRYLQAGIIASGNRCERISTARLWAMKEGGTFTQVLCDSTGEKTGFWYAVYNDNKGKFTQVKPLSGPLF